MKNQNCGTWLVRFKFIDKFQILKHVESIVMKYADSLLKSILQVARYIADPLPDDIPDKFTAEVIRKRKSILRRVKGYSLSDIHYLCRSSGSNPESNPSKEFLMI